MAALTTSTSSGLPPHRAPGQGVRNIVRFNWPFFALAGGGVVLGLLLAPALPPAFRWLLYAGCGAAALSTLVSLGASYLVYDRSRLYHLDWLTHVAVPPGGVVVNINAGFDETSALLHARFSEASLRVFDFYDPMRHTEASIGRARQAYPPFPGTETVLTTALPLADHSADLICVIFTAHEIRDAPERIAFFGELRRALRSGGRVALVEHLRDGPNFLAYNIGFLHFHSRATWARTFAGAGLVLHAEFRPVPLVSVFILASRTDDV